MKLLRIILLLMLLASAIPSCDEGLSPIVSSTPRGTLRGLITFQNWHLVDTMYDMRLAAFREFPPPNLINQVLQGKAEIIPPIGDSALISSRVDSVRFTATVSAGTYPYLAVALQYGPNVYGDWRAVGQYDLDTNLAVPSPITIVPNEELSGIDIHVDFAKPPPQPFP